MMTTETTTRQTLASQIRVIQAEVAHDGNQTIAERLGDLAGRLESRDYRLSIAFCGLFSAGKSSLINALCETAELATGAVPTTSTVSTMTFHAARGDVILMDTPGIDSTDQAHQAAMEAALHKADLVALVMDYQHVEAEDNLEMARMLADQGKQIILVINQIDKHFDWELSFNDFRDRIERTFSDYDIPHEAVFYTTTRASEFNQLDAFRRYLNDLAMHAETMVKRSILDNARDLLEQYVQSSHASDIRDAETRLLDTIGMVPFDLAEGQEWLDERMTALQRLEAEESRVLEDVRTDIESLRTEAVRTIELAQIAPYETTEKGRLYVESLRPGFRVGWLGAKEKTAREVEHRLQAFLGDLMDRAQKFLLWPLQGRLREGVKDKIWANSRWMDDIEGLQVTFTEAQCRALVNDGSLISEQYPYQYVKDVVSAVKRQALSQLNQYSEGWLDDAEKRMMETARRESEQERGQLLAERDAIVHWMDRIAQRDARLRAMVDHLVVEYSGEGAQ